MTTLEVLAVARQSYDAAVAAFQAVDSGNAKAFQAAYQAWQDARSAYYAAMDAL